MNIKSLIRYVAMALLLLGCASAPPDVPYTVFVQVNETNEMFMAGLPGIRAKQFSGDPQRRNTSSLIALPIDWEGSSGASPGKTLEIYVLRGELQLADVLLGVGSYAYLPSGTLGFNMSTSIGADILYFLYDSNGEAVIKTPLLLDSELLDWQATDVDGVTVKELRSDPGSGERVWLRKVEPGAQLPWEKSSAPREGYLASGHYRDSECVLGVAVTDEYFTDGYFNRPPRAVSGGPEAAALLESIWFFREPRAASATIVDTCGAAD